MVWSLVYEGSCYEAWEQKCCEVPAGVVPFGGGVEPTHGMFTSFILNDGHARAKAWSIYTKNGGMAINLVGNIREYEGFIMSHLPPKLTNLAGQTNRRSLDPSLIFLIKSLQKLEG